MELNRYLRVLRQRLLMIIALPVVAALAAGAVSFFLPPVYEAKVALLVRPAQPLGSDPNVQALTTDQISRTYAALMTERPLLQGVSAELSLNVRPDDLAKEITVTPEPNTTILDVSVRDTNPALARDIANRLVVDLVAEVKQFEQQEATISNSRSGDNLVVVSPAVLPDRPVSPNIPLSIAIAFAAGLVIAVGLAYASDYLDQSIKTDEDLMERIGLVSVGHVAFMPPSKNSRSELVTLDSQSHAAEAYKALRTSLHFSNLDKDHKSIVVTSAEMGEGKSRTAANLAVVLSQAGLKTLLVDGDFRRPSQHKIFGRIRNVGLSNLIVGDTDDSAAITSVDSVPNLWLMTSGPTPPNPSELLGSARMRDVLVRLQPHFDYLILDTPPVNAVTDASILAASSAGTLLVIEQGRTTYPAVRHAKQVLDHVGANTIGAVINKIHSSSSAYTYAYGSYEPPSQNGTHDASSADDAEPRASTSST